MNLKCKIKLSLFLILSLISCVCFADAVDTQLSSDHVVLGESFYVTYILTNNTGGRPDFSPLENDFTMLNTNYGNTVNMVNGVTSMQTIWRLQLQPKNAGEAIIPEVTFGNDKSTAKKLVVTANPVTQTTKNNPASSVNAKQGAPVFVRGEISTTSPYVQSQVLYTFKLYFRAQLRDPRVEMPQIKNVAFIQLGDGQDHQTTINGETYNVIEKTFALFSEKPGTVTIPPMQFHAITVDENANAFDNPFALVQPKMVSLATNELNLSVRDIPANYQGSVWLPAKNISLTEDWSDNTGHWETGTPVTRTITIEAEGLRADQLPDLSFEKINGVSIYADRPKRNNNNSNDTVLGMYEQKVTYIPNSAQTFTLPPLKVNWWNTKSNTNAVQQLNAMTVQVKAAANASVPPANIATIAPAVASTTVVSPTQTVSKIFYKSIWFWIACALLVAWLVTLWFMLRKRSHTVSKVVNQLPVSDEISEKSFEQACHAGHAVPAQQYLLVWGKTHWPAATINLATMRELIHDEQFNLALQGLEQALYSKKAVAWNGEALLAAFQKIKKTRKPIKNLNLQIDPLPPINPVLMP
jgi:hypothetical protein